MGVFGARFPGRVAAVRLAIAVGSVEGRDAEGEAGGWRPEDRCATKSLNR